MNSFVEGREDSEEVAHGEGRVGERGDEAPLLRIKTVPLIKTRGVMIPGLESIPESDFEHFSEFDDSNSNSRKYQFFYCTGIDAKI